jgi:hypothetical protein
MVPMKTVYAELQETAKLTQTTEPKPAADASEQAYLGWLAQAVSEVTKEQFDALSQAAQAWFDRAAVALNTRPVRQPIPLPEGYGVVEPAPVLISRPRAAAPVTIMSDTPEPVPVHEPPPAQPVPEVPHEETEPDELEEATQPEAPEIGMIEIDAVAPTTVVEARQRRRRVSRGVIRQQAREATSEEKAAARAIAKEERSAARAAAKAAKSAAKGNGSEKMTVTRRIREYVIEDANITVDEIIDKLKREHLPDMSEKDAYGKDRRATVITLRYDTLRTLSLVKAAGWQPPAR